MAQHWSERVPVGATGRGRTDERWSPVDPISREVDRARTWLVVTGVVAIIGGAVCIAVPAVASVTIALFIGWILVFAGLVMGAHAWSERARQTGAGPSLMAALTFLAGLYLLVFPRSGTITLTVILVIWFLVTGSLLLFAASRLRGLPGAWVTGLNGAVSLLLGILIAVDLPSSAAWAIGLLVGIDLIFWGVRALIVARRLEVWMP